MTATVITDALQYLFKKVPERWRNFIYVGLALAVFLLGGLIKFGVVSIHGIEINGVMGWVTWLASSLGFTSAAVNSQNFWESTPPSDPAPGQD